MKGKQEFKPGVMVLLTSCTNKKAKPMIGQIHVLGARKVRHNGKQYWGFDPRVPDDRGGEWLWAERGMIVLNDPDTQVQEDETKELEKI